VGSIVPPKLALEPIAQPVGRSPETPDETAAAPNQATDNTVEGHANLAPGKLLVQKDADAGRFVQTLTDASSQETIWRYPSEAQLAYSRAVMAYLRALAQR